MNIEQRSREGINYLTVPELEELGVFNMFTMKPTNFKLIPPGEQEKRGKILEACYRAEGIQPKAHYTTRQVHGDRIRIVGEDPDFQELKYWRKYEDSDGMITDEREVVLLIKYADCIPVLLYDPVHKALGNIHSGWRGTLAGIAKKTVKEMEDHYGTNPKDLIVVQGPSIGPDDFEVTGEVEILFRKAFPEDTDVIKEKDPTHRLIDTKELNRRMLIRSGLSEKNIHSVPISTYTDPRMHSYRRDGEKYGLMGLLCGMF